VTRVIPCMRALPDLVALTSFSTELGEVNICLNAWEYEVNNTLAGKRVWAITHPNQKTVSEQAVPRVLWIILLVLVQQQWPLITADSQFATSKPLPYAKLTSNKRSGHWDARELTHHHSNPDQQDKEVDLSQDDESPCSSWRSGTEAEAGAHRVGLTNPQQCLLNFWYRRTLH
jgi:hypothetical protein